GFFDTSLSHLLRSGFCRALHCWASILASVSDGAAMKPRDRVGMSLRHEKPDRCPMQISFTPEFARRLRDDMHQTGRSAHNPHGGGNTYELECALHQDMLLTSVGSANSYYAN